MCIQVAVDIIAKRPSQRPKEIAEDFLTRICAESTLQLALMADAGDEVSHLLRLCDKGLDTAELLTHVSDFAARNDYLFLNGGVYHTMGFAEFTLRTEQNHLLGSQRGPSVHVIEWPRSRPLQAAVPQEDAGLAPAHHGHSRCRVPGLRPLQCLLHLFLA